MRYKLIEIEKNPVTLRSFPKTVRNHVSYSHYQRLEPGKVYETDDEAQIQFLKEHRERVRYNASLEDALKAAGIPYEVIRCKSCGGRVRKIEYNNVEVME